MSNRLLGWAVRWLGLAILYLLFIDALPPAERYAAAIVGVIGVLSHAAMKQPRARYRFRPRWLVLYARRLPLGVIADSFRVLLSHPVAVLAGRSPPRGRFVALPFDAGGDDPESAARRIAVLYGNSITPNAVPIFIDEERGLLVLHQLHHTRESGAGDREWPM